MTAVHLTARQRDLLDFIRSYQAEKGITPSFVEMRDALGLASKSGVHRLVDALEERGCLTRLPNRARAIELAPEAHLKGHALHPVSLKSDPVYQAPAYHHVLWIPLHGRID